MADISTAAGTFVGGSVTGKVTTEDLAINAHAAGASRMDRSRRAVLRSLDSAASLMLRPVTDILPGLAHAHDEFVIRRRMRQSLGYLPDLKNPRTYNEKLGWRILHDKNPLIPLTTDKVSARKYAAGKVSSDILVPVIGIFERVDDIDWDALPQQFVLKATHGCEMNLIVRDKAAHDRDTVLAEAGRWLRRNYYESSREWAYRDLQPRLIVEELLVDEDGKVPPDFKFLVFHGKTAMIRVHLDRFGDHRVNFYDREMQPIPIRQYYPTDPTYVPPPGVSEMALVAERLAEDFDYARIDLYLVRGKTFFGEITHFDGSAQIWFRPPEFDAELGELWQLPITV